MHPIIKGPVLVPFNERKFNYQPYQDNKVDKSKIKSPHHPHIKWNLKQSIV